MRIKTGFPPVPSGLSHHWPTLDEVPWPIQMLSCIPPTSALSFAQLLPCFHQLLPPPAAVPHSFAGYETTPTYIKPRLAEKLSTSARSSTLQEQSQLTPNSRVTKWLSYSWLQSRKWGLTVEYSSKSAELTEALWDHHGWKGHSYSWWNKMEWMNGKQFLLNYSCRSRFSVPR